MSEKRFDLIAELETALADGCLSQICLPRQDVLDICTEVRSLRARVVEAERPPRRRTWALSMREHDVLKHRLDGETQARIADRFGVSRSRISQVEKDARRKCELMQLSPEEMIVLASKRP